MTLKQVQDSVSLMLRFVDDAVDRQNISWSFQNIMDSLDANLQAFVLSKISKMDLNVGRSGPVAFMIVAQRILQTTENLAQKVINGLIALRLTHFDSKNVVECVFTLRNVLKFLRHGEANTFAPRTAIVLLCDVFRGSTVGAFRAHVQQAQDIVLKGINFFDHFQAKCEELLLADRWVPTKKRVSAFHLGGERTSTHAEHDDKNQDKNNGNGGKKDDKNKGEKGERPTKDESGRLIDCTPPGRGQPHERTNDEGRKEFWFKTAAGGQQLFCLNPCILPHPFPFPFLLVTFHVGQSIHKQLGCNHCVV
jgi:hypothetical protein